MHTLVTVSNRISIHVHFISATFPFIQQYQLHDSFIPDGEVGLSEFVFETLLFFVLFNSKSEGIKLLSS